MFFQLLNAVGEVRKAVQVNPELPPLPDINSLNLGKSRPLTPPYTFLGVVSENTKNISIISQTVDITFVIRKFT